MSLSPSPSPKRQRTDDDATPSEPSEEDVCLLLLLRECKQRIIAFLNFEEVLSFRCAHRRLRNDENDAFHYCQIMDSKTHLFGRYYYYGKDNKNLARISCQYDSSVLRAALLNESITEGVLSGIVRNIVDSYGNCTESESSLALLLQDPRCDGTIKESGIAYLEQSLKKGHDGIARVLQEDSRVRPHIKMCNLCSVNIGCYKCSSESMDFCSHPELQYCRSCQGIGPFCKVCDEYLCPSCVEEGKFLHCDSCNGMACLGNGRDRCVFRCPGCRRVGCGSCLQEQPTNWFNDIMGDQWCRPCTDEWDDEMWEPYRYR